MNNQEMELYRAAALTFEQLGFMYPTPELEEERLADDITAAASVEFAGPIRGRLVLMITGGMLPCLGANMLGESDTPPEDQQLDAFGEIANVVCGNVLPRIVGMKHVFSLGSPQVTTGNAPVEWTNGESPVRIRIPFYEGRVDVLLSISASDEKERAA